MYRPEELPPRLQATLNSVRDFATIDPSVMSGEERAAWLVGLQQLSDAAAAFTVTMVSSFDAHGDGELLHAARSTTSWLKGALHISGAEASKRVHLARASRSELASALSRLGSGELTIEHLHVISKAVAGVPVENAEGVATILADLATQIGVDDLAGAARQVREAVNPDGALASTEKDFSRRRLYVSPLLDGMYTIDGILDPESAALVTSALQPFLVPSDAGDDRDTAQRRADGLVALAGVAMDQGQLPISGGSKPNLNVLTTLETLQDSPSPLPTQPRGEWGTGALVESTGGVLGSVATRRIACDATISRVLLDPDGIPVQLGRSQRLFNPQQRKLLALRDAGCRFPGCGLPPAFTDAHHLEPWQDGGPTDLPNGLLVCRWHHRHLHERGWHIIPDDPVAGANQTLTFSGPAGQRLRSSPRRATLEQLGKLSWWDKPPD